MDQMKVLISVLTFSLFQGFSGHIDLKARAISKEMWPVLNCFFLKD
jgi:hypothetical protein